MDDTARPIKIETTRGIPWIGVHIVEDPRWCTLDLQADRIDRHREQRAAADVNEMTALTLRRHIASEVATTPHGLSLASVQRLDVNRGGFVRIDGRGIRG